ncbi:MAG: type II toxin-antitoxin system VapC family toxin [Bacteroidales bacterium]|nr:type II toxin-antitoxin system VapC family toxin [Bacteroidales bacterium]
MNGNKLFIDTNIVLYLLSGDQTLAELLDEKQLHVSFITQLELLGFKDINAKERKLIENFLSECIIIDINNRIKSIVINIKQKRSVKLPDSIIMASAMYLDLPLLTSDADFKKVKELDLIYYER